MSDLLQLWLLKGLMAIFRGLGLDRASAASAWLFRTIGPFLPAHARARTHLLRVMPERAGDAEAILRGMWDNLGRTAAEYAHFDKFQAYDSKGRIELVGAENVEAVARAGKGGIFVSGHFANWELMPLCLSHKGLLTGEVYRAMNNRAVNGWILALRRRFIVERQLPKGMAGAKGMIELLKEGGHIAMLVDQKLNDGISVPFFGIPAMTPPAAAQLALKFGVPLVPVWIERTQGSRFRLTIGKPFEVTASGDKAADIARIMETVNRWLEERIRARPHEWLWPHRRWPKD